MSVERAIRQHRVNEIKREALQKAITTTAISFKGFDETVFIMPNTEIVVDIANDIGYWETYAFTIDFEEYTLMEYPCAANQ